MKSQQDSFEHFISTLSEPNKDIAATLWAKIKTSFTKNIIPQAGPTNDGFQFVYDINEHHLEIDISQSYEVEWFYRNRKTDKYEGSDDIIKSYDLTDQLKYYIMLIIIESEK